MNARRTPVPAPPSRVQRGLSLIEVMVALVLGLVIIGAATSVYLSSRQAYVTNDALAEVQDNARIAYELLARDLRQAGATGCGNLFPLLHNVSGGTWFEQFDKNENGVRGFDDGTSDPAAPDRTKGSSVLITGVASRSATVQASTATTLTLNNDPPPAYTAGQPIIVCQPDGIAYTHASSSLAGLKLGLTYVTGTLTLDQVLPNAVVSALNVNDWFVGPNPQGSLSLYRHNVESDVTQEMVRGVQDMVLSWRQPPRADFTTATNITDWSQVNAVRLDLTLTGSVRTAGVGGTPIARHLVGVITLRNRM